MAWMKIETAVARNRKFVQAGPGPSWLWICGLAYCQEGLTDGFIPTEALPFLGVKSAPALVRHLVAAGLWNVVTGGWRVHDYLAHNKTATEVLRLQDHRRGAGVKGGRASGEARREANGEAPAEANTEAPAEATAKQLGNHLGNPDQIRSDSSDQISSEKAVPPARARLSPIHPKRRMDAAFEGPRVYVPNRVHQDFLALRQCPEQELFDWYLTVSNQWFDGDRKGEETGPDMIKFWKARYDETWPATSPGKAGKAPWPSPLAEWKRIEAERAAKGPA